MGEFGIEEELPCLFKHTQRDGHLKMCETQSARETQRSAGSPLRISPADFSPFLHTIIKHVNAHSRPLQTPNNLFPLSQLMITARGGVAVTLRGAIPSRNPGDITRDHLHLRFNKHANFLSYVRNHISEACKRI